MWLAGGMHPSQQELTTWCWWPLSRLTSMMREVQLLINAPQMHTAIMWSKDWSWSGQNMASLNKWVTCWGTTHCKSILNASQLSGYCLWWKMDRPVAPFWLALWKESMYCLWRWLKYIAMYSKCCNTWVYTHLQAIERIEAHYDLEEWYGSHSSNA